MIFREFAKKAARLWFSAAIAAALILSFSAFEAHAADPTTKPQTQTGQGDDRIPAPASGGTLEGGEQIKPNEYVENYSGIVLQENREPVGRDLEAKDVRAALDTDSGIAVVVGEPGIGKTEVVRQYIYDNKTHMVYRLKTDMLFNLSRADRARVVKSVIIYMTRVAASHPELPTRLYIDNVPFLDEGTANEVKASGAITEAISAKRPIAMILETNAKTNQAMIKASPRFGDLQHTVEVETPVFDSVIASLRREHDSLEATTKASISGDALAEAAKLAIRLFATDPFHKAKEILLTAGYKVAADLKRGENDARAANRELAVLENELKVLNKDLAHGADAVKQARVEEINTKKLNLTKIVQGKATPDTSTLFRIAELSRELVRLNAELDMTPAGKMFEGKERRTILDQITAATTQLEEKRSELILENQPDGTPSPRVFPKQVQAAASELSGVDEATISMDIKDGLKRVGEISEELFNQDHLIARARTAIATSIKMEELREQELRANPNKEPEIRLKPIWSVLVPGRTGTGKTQFGLLLGKKLGMPTVTIHMTSYGESHHSSGLLGAKPEYAGYGKDGELTGPVRKTPYILIVLDEIQRAHIDVIKTIVYPILDQGFITDGEGRKVYFDKAILVAPTNAGEKFSSMKREELLKFLKEKQDRLRDEDLAKMNDTELRSECVKIDLHETYGWEESMVGRWDDILSSNDHTPQSIENMAHQNAKRLVKTLASRGIKTVFTVEEMEALIGAFDEKAGGRSIETTFKRDIQGPLFEKWGLDEIKKGDTVIIDNVGGRTKFSVLPSTTVSTAENMVKLTQGVANQGHELEAAGKGRAKLSIFDEAFMIRKAVLKALEAYRK